MGGDLQHWGRVGDKRGEIHKGLRGKNQLEKISKGRGGRGDEHTTSSESKDYNNDSWK